MAELEMTRLPTAEVPVTMMLYVPIDAFLAAPTVIFDVAVPPAGTLIPLGLNEADRLPLVNCAARYTVPVKPWMLIIETVEVAFAPCGTVTPEGLVVNTKVPVGLWASLIVNGRTDPLTVKEPRAKIRSKIPALRGTRFMNRVVVHSSELNP
jgi:hypothetical protein